MNTEKTYKKVRDSYVEQVYVVRPPHVNGYGRLFGGQLMQWIDETAGIAARRHAQCTITTASIDNLSFKMPAYQNDTIVLNARLTYVGTTSMEVRVDTYIEEICGERRLINTAYLVLVAIDEDGKACQVPGLSLDSDEERENWELGERRYHLRKQRNREGY
ncbi:MAG: acyl-CoA thioesterase [Lachnospiraceae bacterium]|nr:acyl-CoA thioesterase [Lachnospiraceae bacterium]